jgi:S1-C subfamily serine protease
MGVRIQSVEAGSPATVAGIKRGDVIVEAGGISIASVDDLQRALGADAIDRELPVVVLRRDQKLTLSAVPIERGAGRPDRAP